MRISLLCSDLERNPLYTPWMFAGALASRHDVDVVGPAPRRLWPPAEGEVRPTSISGGRHPLRAQFRRSARKATAAADLLYAFKAHPASFGAGLWLRRQLDVPLALHLDDWDGGYFVGVPAARRLWYALRGLRSPEDEVYVRLLERLASRADLLTVSSTALQRRFGGCVIRQGVDGERFAPERFSREEARRRIGVEDGVPLVVFVGTPSLHKGLTGLMQAFRMLRDDLPARLLIIGSPPDPESARLLSAGAGGGIECRPDISFAEVPWFIAGADVACAPQESTPFARHQLPAKVLHWMTMGACVVATDVGDAAELLGGDPAAGRVVPPGDAGALRDVLVELLADDALRRSLGTEARRRAERSFTWEAMAGQLETQFRERAWNG